VYGKLVFPLSFARLLIDCNLYNAVKGVPGVPTSEADPASATEPSDRQTDKNTFASVSLNNDDINLRIFQNTLEQKLDPYIWGASSNQTGQTGIEWQQKIGLGNIVYGLEAREDRGKTTMSGDHAIRNYAAFIQDEVQLLDQHVLVAGIRGDKHSTAGTSYNPRLGWVFQQSPGTAWRASVGNAFRAPTLNELYWNDGWMFGDASLKPEKSFTYELGLEKKLSENSSARLSYYASTVTDLILWDWQSSTIETRAKNVGEAFMEGVELEWERKLGERGKAFINYTYQKAVDRKDFDALAVGKTIRYTPQTKYNAGLVLGESSLLIRHVGERFADQYNTITLPAYTVVDLKLAKKIKAMEIEFSVDNLFNESYSEIVGNNPTTWAVTKYPMPGRKYQAGVKWEL
jgi:outer membrane cobalamin receptor